MGNVSSRAVAALACLFGLGVTAAHAGAFQLNERSTKVLGASLAGAASSAQDVVDATFNPAALSTVEMFDAGGSVTVVVPKADGTIQAGPFAGTTLDGGRTGVVPSLSLGYRITDKLVVGFTSYAPFGLKTEYSDDSPLQADAQKSKLRTISLSPTASYDLTDNLTVGAALDILYADAELTSAVVDLEGHTWAYSFSAGLLFRPVEGTQLGLAYHHGYDIEVDTDTFLGLPGHADTKLPNWVQFGVTQQVNDSSRVMAEGRWVNWSRFDSIDIHTPALQGTPFGLVSEPQNYRDAWFFGLGAEYDLNGRLTLRSGIAYDQTPTTNAWRTVRVPDADRLWLSAGASYRITDRLSLDASYSYLPALDHPDATLRNGPLAGTPVRYDAAAQIISLGASFRF